MASIYVDHAATTPLHPQVVNAMLPYLQEYYGNPSSIHAFGRKAKAALEQSRAAIARCLGAEAKEIILTGSGTEADNLAVIGAALANQERGKHVLSSQVEHHAVLHALKHLESLGFEVTYLPVDQEGRVSRQTVEEALRPDTVLVSLIMANNETGTLNHIEEIGSLLQEKEILFHTDAVQALGVVPIDLTQMPVDLASFSGHKINGPQGSGCLFVKETVKLKPLTFGGSQERGRRAGTENVAAAIGLAEAVRIATLEREERVDHYQRLKRTLLDRLQAEGVNYLLNGDQEGSVPQIVNLSFPGVKANALLTNLDLAGIAASSGSACTAGSLSPSHVILAMHADEERAACAVRFSFGSQNTVEEMEQVAATLAEIIDRMRSHSY